MHHLQHTALLNSGLGLFNIVVFWWLHHILSLADVTKQTKACTLLQGKNDIKAVMLPELVVYYRAERA
jgi:hypothetical protein